MTWAMQKPRRTVDPAQLRLVVDRVRFEGLSLRVAVAELGCTKDYLRATCWDAARSDTLARDGGRCAQCGARADDVHHRCPKAMGGTSAPLIAFGLGNLVSLDRRCHTFTETEGRSTGWSYDKGYLVRHPVDPTTVPVLFLQHGWVRLDHYGGMTPCPPPDTTARRSAA